MLSEAWHLARSHVGPGRDDETVVWERAGLGLDGPCVGVDRGGLRPGEVDAAPLRRRGERDLQLLGVEPERDVDRVRLEEEVILIRDQGELCGIVREQAQVEGRL